MWLILANQSALFPSKGEKFVYEIGYRVGTRHIVANLSERRRSNQIKIFRGVVNISKSLSAYSPFLHSFNMSSHFEQIEMFGQYGDADVEPDPSRVKISSFGENLTIFTSIRRPFKLTLIGDNGKSYNLIVKHIYLLSFRYAKILDSFSYWQISKCVYRYDVF